MMKVVGTCGNCGGSVCVPQVWYGVRPPVASCESCGAVPRGARPPVMDMEPPRGRPTQQPAPLHAPFPHGRPINVAPYGDLPYWQAGSE